MGDQQTHLYTESAPSLVVTDGLSGSRAFELSRPAVASAEALISTDFRESETRWQTGELLKSGAYSESCHPGASLVLIPSADFVEPIFYQKSISYRESAVLSSSSEFEGSLQPVNTYEYPRSNWIQRQMYSAGGKMSMHLDESKTNEDTESYCLSSGFQRSSCMTFSLMPNPSVSLIESVFNEQTGMYYGSDRLDTGTVGLVASGMFGGSGRVHDTDEFSDSVSLHRSKRLSSSQDNVISGALGQSEGMQSTEVFTRSTLCSHSGEFHPSNAFIGFAFCQQTALCAGSRRLSSSASFGG
jgi:hypothetical protein